jgi:ABC-2 type transport system ATP-binding protein
LNFSILKNVNLSIKSGINGLIGRNGAGKSTLLKCISGILPFENGKITVNGISVKDDDVKIKRITGFLFESPFFYESLTGEEFLNFIESIRKNAPLKNELVDIFDIKSFLRTKIEKMPKGIKQRLALISCFMHDPDLILLDEPVNGIDPFGVKILKKILKRFEAQNKTVIISTHILELAEKLCSRIIVIDGGEIKKHGETHTLLKDKNLENLFINLTGTPEEIKILNSL